MLSLLVSIKCEDNRSNGKNGKKWKDTHNQGVYQHLGACVCDCVLPWYPLFIPQMTGGFPPGTPVIENVSVWH